MYDYPDRFGEARVVSLTLVNQNIHFHFVECHKTINKVARRFADICGVELQSMKNLCVRELVVPVY